MGENKKIHISAETNNRFINLQLQFSTDWRFLLGSVAKGIALISADNQVWYAQELDTKFSSLVLVNQNRRLAKLDKELLGERPKNIMYLQTDLLDAPFLPFTFDFVCMPTGFPSNIDKEGRKSQDAYIRAAFHLIRPGGVFCIGFTNRWHFNRVFKRNWKYSSFASLDHIVRLIKRFECSSLKIYGAIPNHLTPTYIFPLKANTMSFVLKRHYGHKLPNFLINLSSNPIFNYIFRYLLPSYLVVAKT